MFGMFASLDMLMFYLFFEGVLIPMFIIIGVWGGAERVYAAFKFFIYAFGFGIDAGVYAGDVSSGRHNRYPGVKRICL